MPSPGALLVAALALWPAPAATALAQACATGAALLGLLPG